MTRENRTLAVSYHNFAQTENRNIICAILAILAGLRDTSKNLGPISFNLKTIRDAKMTGALRVSDSPIL